MRLHKQNNTKHFIDTVSSVFVSTNHSQVTKLQLIFSYATLALPKPSAREGHKEREKDNEDTRVIN